MSRQGATLGGEVKKRKGQSDLFSQDSLSGRGGRTGWHRHPASHDHSQEGTVDFTTTNAEAFLHAGQAFTGVQSRHNALNSGLAIAAPSGVL